VVDLTALLLASLLVSVKARAIQPGELLVVDVTAAATADAVSVRAFGRETPAFRVDRDHWRALIGVDLDAALRTYRIEAAASSSGRTVERGGRDIRVRPRQFATRRLRVDEAFVNPPAESEPRIAAEGAELARIFATVTPARSWTAPFVRPVPGPANSAFGTRSLFNGQPRNPHSGGDFLSPAGTPVKAPNAGRVVLARDLYYSGNTVVIDHGLGLYSLLAHLSAIDVREGSQVRPGQVIGKVGATGRVTGPHLHWAVHVAGARIDPLSLLTLLGD
jgi:murein DD-endopeptidase MepM/ murein hydrolase activator NlpD